MWWRKKEKTKKEKTEEWIAKLKAIGDESPYLRSKIAKALGEIGDTLAIEPLIRLLSDDYPGVRRSAIEALEKIGLPAIKPLISVFRHEDWLVRNYSSETLKAILVSIDTVIFGTGEFDTLDQHIWYNPEVSELTASMSKLKTIEVFAEVHDFHQVERFITYAVNYIGQEYLKEHVEVHIYGDPGKLHPNLRNTFTNLCKCVNVHEKIQE